MIPLHHFRRASIAILALVIPAIASARERVDLNGAWRFAVDPVRRGEQNGWHQPALNVRDWAEVQVPHCWTVDPRFPYTGSAWYRRSFSLPPRTSSRHARILFDGVFYRAKVWVNGELVGAHEGGYTPFQFDVTDVLRPSSENTLAIEVDNSWDTGTLPGARIGSRPQDQVYPWMEYGGIVRPVALVLTDPLYVAHQRVIATPESAAGGAVIEITAHVANASDQPAKVRLGFAIAPAGEPRATGSREQNDGLSLEAVLPPRSRTPLATRTHLDRGQVRLWDVDHPSLYNLRTRLWRADRTLADEPDAVSFGIRRIEATAGQLRLNGEPIRMGGGNRHADHPRFGSMDPPEVVEADMRQMKRANMTLCRISHYPVSALLLDWADRNGMLVIEEGLNWQLTEAQMDSDDIRHNFQRQMREMIERDWNHPSVIGWSVGNEYPSETPSGLRWTKDMADFVRAIDRTRLLTFASDRAGSPKITTPDDEGSRFVDLVCVNIYEDYAGKLDRIHSRWPDKPVMVSEFASPGHTKPADCDYGAYFRDMMATFRGRPYVVGAAVWTYNDYRSRYPRTDPDGYRRYGAVTAERQPKATFELFASEFSPAAIEDARASADAVDGGRVVVSCSIRARPDFPSHPLRDYSVRFQVLDAGGDSFATRSAPLPALGPGDSHPLNARFELSGSPMPAIARIEVIRPTGFVTAGKDCSIPRPQNPE